MNTAETLADSQSSGTLSVCKDLLKRMVSYGASSSEHSFNNLAGIIFAWIASL